MKIKIKLIFEIAYFLFINIIGYIFEFWKYYYDINSTRNETILFTIVLFTNVYFITTSILFLNKKYKLITRTIELNKKLHNYLNKEIEI